MNDENSSNRKSKCHHTKAENELFSCRPIISLDLNDTSLTNRI